MTRNKSKIVALISASAAISIMEAGKAIDAFNACLAEDPNLLGSKRRNKSDRKRDRANRWR